MLVKVIQKGMRNDTTIPGLPNVLFVSFEEPPAFDGQHCQDIGSSWRRRLDRTGRVQIAEPKTVRQMGSLQKFALGILTGLTDLRRKSLLGRHGSCLYCYKQLCKKNNS